MLIQFLQLEAAIIDGATCEYRAAAGLRHTKNPIQLARSMLALESPNLIVGDAADELAVTQGLHMVENTYFTTAKRRQFWLAKKAAATSPKDEHGTVGAVVLDVHGNLAAANSTGGIMMKSIGRVGDTAIPGAGIYADDQVAIAW